MIYDVFNEWWRHINPMPCHFLPFWSFFYHLILSVWTLIGLTCKIREHILLLIELIHKQLLKYKLLHYSKVNRYCHWIARLHNNNMFHKNFFLRLEILLKDIFEKCWHHNSCILKMNNLSYLSIAQSDYFL